MAAPSYGAVDRGRHRRSRPQAHRNIRRCSISCAQMRSSRRVRRRKGSADYPNQGARRCCRPYLAPEKNICVGINYPDRSAEYKDGRGGAEISQPVLPLRSPRWSAPDQPIVRPKVSEQIRLRGRNRAGRAGKAGMSRSEETHCHMIGGMTLGNEGSVRDWLRHGTLERHAGQELRQVRQPRTRGGDQPTKSIRQSLFA